MKPLVNLLLPVLVTGCSLFIVQCTDPNSGSKQENKQEAGSELDRLNALVSKDSRNPDNLLKRSVYFNSVKRFNNALNDINLAIQLDSMRADLWMTRGDAYFGLVQVPAAMDAFHKVITLDPAHTDAYLKLAELSLYVKDYQAAIANANGALKNEARNKKAYFIKGFVYKESGDTAKALSSFQTCVEIDPRFYDAHMQLGMLYGAMNNKLALQYYNHALQINGRSIETYYDRAMFYQESGEYNRAMEDYQAILAIEPGNKLAHFNLGYIHLAYLKVYRQALRHFSDAIRSDSSYIEAWYNRGVTFENLGDIGNAAHDYRKALTLYPQYEPAREGS